MVPEKNDPRWRRALTSEEGIALKSLPSKLLISKLRFMLKEDPSPQSLRHAVDMAHDYFSRNEEATRDDLRALLEE